MNDIVERLRNIAVNVRNNTPKGILSTTTIYEDALEALAERDATIASLKQERDEACKTIATLNGYIKAASEAEVRLRDRATTAEHERDKAREVVRLALLWTDEEHDVGEWRTAARSLTQKAETE